MSLVSHAWQAFKWSALGEAASKIVAPLTYLILARLLVPEDFGVIGAATIVISLSQVFSEAGLGKALIQRPDRVEDSANVVFWLNLVLGFAIAGFLSVTAPLIAGFFHDARIAPVIRVLSLQLPLAAFSSAHTALLQRELEFRRLFWVRLLTSTIPALFAIPLAWYGFGYWALVAGSLTGQIAQSLMLWFSSAWRPRRSIDRSLARTLVGFGKWAAGSGLLTWFYVWVDSVVVGHYLGSHDMGLYRVGSALVGVLLGLVTSALMPVVYSTLCKYVASGMPHIGLLQNVSILLTIVSCTLAFGLIILVGPLLAVIGPQWAGADRVVVVLALTFALSSFVMPTLEAYRATGIPHVETASLALMTPVYIALYISMNATLNQFLTARLCAAALSLGVHWFLGWRYARLPLNWPLAPMMLIIGLVTSTYLGWADGDGAFPSAAVQLQRVAIFGSALFLVVVMNRRELTALAAQLR